VPTFVEAESEIIALAPKNSVNILDTTTLNYSNATHVDEKVNRFRLT